MTRETTRARIVDLTVRLRQLTGADFERALEAALHQTWDDGWREHEKPEPGRNPYNVLTRVPEDFLKIAMEIATARSEFLEKNLDQHLFPGMFQAAEPAPVDAVLFPVREPRDGATGVCALCQAPLLNYNELCTCLRTGTRSQR